MPQRRRRDRIVSKAFVRAAVRFTREVANQVRVVLNAAPKPKKQSEEAIIAIARTAMKRTLLVSRLVHEGCYSDAAVLARTLIDLAVTGSYLTETKEGIAREHLASRFMGFEDVQFHEYLRRKANVRDSDFPSILARKRQVTGVFSDIEKKQNLGWAGISQDQMVQAIRDREIREPLDNLRRKYGFVFSAFVHPTPMGVEAVPFWGELMVSNLAWCSVMCLFSICNCLVEADIDLRDSRDLFEAELRRYEAEEDADTKLEPLPALPLLEWMKSRASKR